MCGRPSSGESIRPPEYRYHETMMDMTCRLVLLAAMTVLAGCAPAMTSSPAPPVSSGTSQITVPVSSPPVSSGTPQITVPVPTPPAPAGLKQVHDPGHVTGVITGPCRARGQLPDPACTPGAIDPAVTQADIRSTICVRGWTARVRPPVPETSVFKRLAYAAYGIPAGTASELDHLVPLELGGANDAANLWPEAGRVPNAKDETESVLHTAVCSGKVTLAAAQDAIAADWLTAGQILGLAGT